MYHPLDPPPFLIRVMEVLLNIVWLALCNLALCYWLRRWQHGNERRSMAVQLATLACVLVLLFPVISATDDLYASQVPFETTNTQKSSRTASSGKSSFHQLNHHTPHSALPDTFSLSAHVCLGVVADCDALAFCPALIAGPQQDRAPPRFLFL